MIDIKDWRIARVAFARAARSAFEPTFADDRARPLKALQAACLSLKLRIQEALHSGAEADGRV